MIDKPDLTTVAGRVAYCRSIPEDLSARELDRIAGLHTGHTWAIESGGRENLERATAKKLADAFGTRVGWVLEGEGDAPTSEQVRAAVDAARARYATEHAATGTDGR